LFFDATVVAVLLLCCSTVVD